VLRRAKQLNYQMNWVARSLVTRRTYTIGLLLPEFTHSFFAEVARTVAETVRPHGYHVVISCFEEDPEQEASEATAMLARQVDGLIIATSQPPRRLDLFKRIQERKVPYVLIDRLIAGARACFVGVDNHAIGELATEHLIDRGCGCVAHLRGPEVGIATERLEGYRRALARRGFRTESRYVVAGGHADDTGYTGMRQLLKVCPMPDGVFLEAGLKLPQDISVVGAGNIHYSDVLAVPLTTVDQGTCRMGVLAAELLLERIASKQSMKTRKIMITPTLVERESTRREA
jgi:LacI family transcriptional regulator